MTSEFRRMMAQPVFSADGQPSAEWATLHNRYHNALVSACGSDWLLKMRQMLFEQSERYRNLTISSIHEAAIRSEHERLTAAALARDLDAVLTILRSHLQKTRDAVLRLVESGQPIVSVENGNRLISIA